MARQVATCTLFLSRPFFKLRSMCTSRTSRTNILPTCRPRFETSTSWSTRASECLVDNRSVLPTPTTSAQQRTSTRSLVHQSPILPSLLIETRQSSLRPPLLVSRALQRPTRLRPFSSGLELHLLKETVTRSGEGPSLLTSLPVTTRLPVPVVIAPPRCRPSPSLFRSRMRMSQRSPNRLSRS